MKGLIILFLLLFSVFGQPVPDSSLMDEKKRVFVLYKETQNHECNHFLEIHPEYTWGSFDKQWSCQMRIYLEKNIENLKRYRQYLEFLSPPDSIDTLRAIALRGADQGQYWRLFKEIFADGNHTIVPTILSCNDYDKLKRFNKLKQHLF